LFNAARNAIHAKFVLEWQHFRSNVLFHAHTACQHFVNVIQKLVHLKKKENWQWAAILGWARDLTYGAIRWFKPPFAVIQRQQVKRG
jgi:hypothetical protein